MTGSAVLAWLSRISSEAPSLEITNNQSLTDHHCFVAYDLMGNSSLLDAGVQCMSCERNWSTWDYIHNKRRNRLSSAQCRRLVYVFTNQ